MFNVQFPGLGISFTINPEAFEIGGHAFKWYGVIIGAAFLLAFVYVMVSCKKFKMDQDKLIDAVIVGLIGGVIGARLYYVLFDASDEFVKNPVRILYIWEGGLAIYGGIIGGLLCGGLIAKLHKLSVPAVLDMASLGFLIGQSIGRWGNFINQEAFGTATNLPWRMVSQNTEIVSSTGVHPCFLYESLWCIIGFVLLHIFSRKYRRYDGQVFLLYVVWYGLGRFWIEGLRTDSLITPFFALRISQVVAAASVVVSAVLLVAFRRRTVLTGCGSAKIMELNSIVDEVKLKKAEERKKALEDDGTSTIFESSEDTKKVLAGVSIHTGDATEKPAEQKNDDTLPAPGIEKSTGDVSSKDDTDNQAEKSSEEKTTNGKDN